MGQISVRRFLVDTGAALTFIKEELLTVKAEPLIVKKDPAMVIMAAAKPLTFFRAKPLIVVKDKAEL
jgi:hypothetical protein